MRRLFRQLVSRGARRDETSPRTRSEAGDTLVEVLLALLVLSLASVALILAFSTSISASAEHRRLVTADLVVGSVSQNAIANIEGNLQLFACSSVQSGQSTPVTTTTYLSMVQGLNFDLVPAEYAGTYTASVTGVEWWSGTAFSSTCNAGDPEEITVTVTNTSTGVTYVNTFVVSFPLTTTNSVSGSAPGTSLIFSTQPSDSSTSNGVTTYGEAGAALITQPVVEVLDAAGDPVSTDYSPAILSIASGPAGGVLTGCVGNETVGGIVSFSGCTLSLQGTYTLIATDGNLTSAPSSQIIVGALGDYLAFPNNHQPVAGQSGSAFSTEPVVEVLTATGTVDQSWVGTITLTASGGDLASSCSGTITAANDGVWTAPSSCTFAGAITDNPSNGNINAAPYTMTATGSSTNSPVIPVVPVTSNPFSVTSPGPPTQLVFATQPTGAAGIGAAYPFASFSVTMEDAFGNIAYTSTNTIDLAISGTGSLKGCSSGAITTTPDDYGVATFTGCYGTATGNGLTLTATAATGSLTPATSLPFNITGPAYALVFTRQPVANASGQTLLTQPQVTIEDANGNVVTSSTAVITLTPSGGTLSYCTSLNAVAGVVNVTGCTFAGLVGTQYTMTATSGTLLPATSSSFSPTGPGVPTQIAFTTEPVAGAAGSPFTTSPVVSLEDSGGNVVTTAFSTATFAASGGTLNCPALTVQIVDGVGDLDGCTFGGVVGTQYQLTVSSPNLTEPTSDPGTATSTNFSPTGPGPAAAVAITSTSTPNPPTASSTTNVALTLQLTDAWGNDTTSTSATQFSLTSTSTKGFFAGSLGVTGTLGAAGAVTIPANTGTGTLYYGDENAGQPFVGAENVAAAAEWGSEQLTIVPAAPSQVALTTTCPSSLASGGTCTVTATVEDPFGNAETTGGAGVVFAEGAGDAGSLTLSGQTSSGGTSTITVKGGRVGAVTVNTTTPFAAATPVSFTVTVGSASKIAISAGANQSATVATSFTNPLSALVTDAYGNPVAGAVVTFTAPASGASGTFLAASNGGTCLATGGTAVASCTAVTGTNGIASSLTYTANNTAGAYNVAVTSPATTPNPLNFAETNTPAPPTKVVFTTEPPSTGTAGTALTNFKVSVEDQFGNTVTTGAGSTDDITLSIKTGPAGGVFNSATATYTNVAAVGGVATFSGVYFDTPGSYTLTATDSSRTLTTATSTPATAISAAPANKVIFTVEPPATTTAGATLASFAVSVEDQYGNVVTTGAGSADTITLTSSCTLTGTDSVAAVGGVATFNAVAITKGTICTLTATDSSRTLITATSSPATTVTPAAANKVAFTVEPPATTTAGATLASFAVSVEDQYGNLIATGTGSTDTIALTSTCTLGGTDSVTATGGVATFNAVTITKGATCTLTATDSSRTLTTATSTPPTTVTAAAANKVVFTVEPPATGTAGTALTSFAVSVEDQYGNVVTTGAGSGDTIALTSGCTLGGTDSVTAAGGVATFNAVTITSTGSCTLTATDSSRTLTTATSTPATVVGPAGANKVVFTVEPPATTTAGATLASFAVSVEDQYGNLITTGTGSFDQIALTSSCTLGGTDTATAAGGVATFNAVTITKGTICTLTATDTSRTLITATSSPATTVTPAAANKVVFTVEPPATTTAGATLASFAVSVEDQYGNLIATGTGSTDTIALTSSCTLGGTDSVTATGGVATFNAVTITNVGSCTLTATDSSRTLTTANSSPATTVTAGAANKVVFTVEPPATGTAGTALTSFAVSVEDQYGNVVTTGAGSGDTIALTSTCTLGGTDSVAAVGGVATFNAATITSTGSCTLTATDSSRTLTTATSSPATVVSPAGANKVVFTVEPPATTTAGATLASFAVSVEDQYGNLITTGTGSTDTIALTSTCTLGGTDSVTATGGVATFNAVTITKGTTCTLTATDSSRTLTTANSSPATTVTAAAANKVIFTVEPPTAATAGTALTSFAVSVEDQYGNVVTTGTGSTDTIALTSTCTLGGTDSVAAVGGVATFNAVTITNVASCTLTATDSSRVLTTATSSPATVVSPGAANKVAFTTEPPATTTAGATLATFRVSVEDSSGNVITTGTGSTDTIALTSSTCTLAGTDSVAAVAGVATFSAATITTGTSCTLTATDSTRVLTTATSTPATTVTAAAASKVAFTVEPPATGTAGATLASFAVSIEDQYGNVVTAGTGSGDTIALTSTCTLGGTDSVTAAGGVATFNAVTISSSGSCTLTATDASRTLTTANSAPATVISPAAASKVVFTTEPPATGTAGTALTTFVVSVEDQYGNVVTTGADSADSIALTSSCALGGTDSVAAVGGEATYGNVDFTSTGSCTLTATDSTHTLTTATSSPATVVSPGLANKVAFTTEPPATTVAGVALATFRVSVEDSSGNVITTGTGSTDTIAITSTCTLTGTESAAAVGGVATFSAVTITKGTTCTLTATDSTRGLATATSSPATTVTPAAANKVIFTVEPPATTTAGATLASFAVSVEDTYGNVVTAGTGSTDTIALTSTCTLGGTDSVVAVGGVATFTAATINVGTSCTLTATDSSRTLTTATSTPATTVTPAAPNQLAFDVAPPTTATSGTNLTTFSVWIEDQYGNVETTGNTGATDRIDITGSAGCTISGGGSNPITAANGLATFTTLKITTTSSPKTCTLTVTDQSRTLAGTALTATVTVTGG